MAIEDVGADPEILAQAIHRQMGPITKAVPLLKIAAALDIEEIRYAPLDSFEGALLTTPERDVGRILVNEYSQPNRRRFTIAHELGHYLNVWHQPTSEAGFMCSKKDMGTGRIIVRPGMTVHERQEFQANLFAIELLAPRKLIENWTSDEPSLAEALAIGKTLELSKSAAARRYVELHPARTAVAYTINGFADYHISSRRCPRIILRKGDRLIRPHSIGRDVIVTSEIDLKVRKGTDHQIQQMTVHAETLFQQQHYAMTLLNLEPDDEDEDDES